MTVTTHSIEAADKRRGLTVEELAPLLQRPDVSGDARIIVRVGGRGQIKALKIEVQS